MTDKGSTDADQSTPLGLYARRGVAMGLSNIERVALAITVIWLLVCIVFFVFMGGADSGANMQFILTLMVVFLPVAMVWVAATAARSSRVVREESARLQIAIDAIRRSYLQQAEQNARTAEPVVTRKLDEIAMAQKKTEDALAMFTSSRTLQPQRPATAPEAAAPAAGSDQVSLPLGTPAEDIAPPLSNVDLIRALNFPENTDDKEGFAALRRALSDRQVNQLVQAAQDVLTLLSQDGIYMDDLRHDRARPEIWRQFANGTRGRAIAPLGGVRDRSSLALTAGRMRQDTVFRDSAHHFLRLFDKMLSRVEPQLADHEIADLADTRTARAFMLLGRVAGTFA